MKKETREQLIKKGRKDLVDAFDLSQSGYAGVNSQGMIVDRRKHPEAIAIQKNSMFPILPEPKRLTRDVLMLECQMCNDLLDKITVAGLPPKDEDLISCGLVRYCPECGRDIRKVVEEWD